MAKLVPALKDCRAKIYSLDLTCFPSEHPKEQDVDRLLRDVADMVVSCGKLWLLHYVTVLLTLSESGLKLLALSLPTIGCFVD